MFLFLFRNTSRPSFEWNFGHYVDYYLSFTPRLSHTLVKVRKRAKIRNQYNQAPHLTQDTNGKVTTSQLDITNIFTGNSEQPEIMHNIEGLKLHWR